MGIMRQSSGLEMGRPVGSKTKPGRVFEGGPCKAGHNLRYAANGNCVQCAKDKGARIRALMQMDTRRDKPWLVSRPDKIGRRAGTRNRADGTVTGPPCQYGHTERYAVSRNCAVCARRIRRERYAAGKGLVPDCL